MKILALIAARGGSKRLPGKNIKLLGGRPLIAWTIQVAQKSACCTDILVSTDDAGIAAISREYGASVPWMRPAYLGTDTATSVDVAIHAVDAYEAINGKVDGLLLLQPTSPFRSAESIIKAVSMFEAEGGRVPFVSVSPASSHPAWCFDLTESGMRPFLNASELNGRSQDLKPAWALNGSIYLISPERLRVEQTFLPKDAKPIRMPEKVEGIDIDDPFDWDLAEMVLSKSANRSL